MKYLKLNASYEECHGLAMALVGSPAIPMSGNLLIKDADMESLFGIDYDVFLTHDQNGYTWPEQIVIPIDTIKLCPYVAMREGLRVLFSGYVPGEGDWTDNPMLWTYERIKDSDIDISESRLKIDPENLPKGAEIVEA